MIRKLASNGNLDQIFTGGFVSTPLERHSLFGRASYDITDNVSAYVQTSYSNVSREYSAAACRRQSPCGRHQFPSTRRTPIPAALASLLASRAVDPAPRPAPRDRPRRGACPRCWTTTDRINTDQHQQRLADPCGPEGQDRRSVTGPGMPMCRRGDTNIIAETSGLPSLQRYQFLVAKPNFGTGHEFHRLGQRLQDRLPHAACRCSRNSRPRPAASRASKPA